MQEQEQHRKRVPNCIPGADGPECNVKPVDKAWAKTIKEQESGTGVLGRPWK